MRSSAALGNRSRARIRVREDGCTKGERAKGERVYETKIKTFYDNPVKYFNLLFIICVMHVLIQATQMKSSEL